MRQWIDVSHVRMYEERNFMGNDYRLPIHCLLELANVGHVLKNTVTPFVQGQLFLLFIMAVKRADRPNE